MKDFERIDQLTKDYDKLMSAIISQKDRLNKLSESINDASFQCACIITELSLMNIVFEMTGKKEKQQLDDDWETLCKSYSKNNTTEQNKGNAE